MAAPLLDSPCDRPVTYPEDSKTLVKSLKGRSGPTLNMATRLGFTDKDLGTVTLTAAISFHCRLHYAEAVLSELFRITTVAPVTPPHRATEDTTLNGYFIPKVCIYGGVLLETCSLANQLHLYHQGDGDGVGFVNVGFYNYVTRLPAVEDFYRVL